MTGRDRGGPCLPFGQGGGLSIAFVRRGRRLSGRGGALLLRVTGGPCVHARRCRRGPLVSGLRPLCRGGLFGGLLSGPTLNLFRAWHHNRPPFLLDARGIGGAALDAAGFNA